MLDNIKDLHGRIIDKRKSAQAVSERCGIKAKSVENNWFSGQWAIPEKHLLSVVTILQNQLREQTTNNQKALEDIEVVGMIELKGKN